MATVRCTEAFAHFVQGYPDVARPGDLFDSKDPIVKVGGPARFEPVEVAAARNARVEEATAAPNRRRSITRQRPAKKAVAAPVVEDATETPAEQEPVEAPAETEPTAAPEGD